MTLLAVFFLLPLLKSFLRVCLPTLFAAVLKLFLPLPTFAISSTAKSNISAPTRFAAGRIKLRKREMRFFQIIVQVDRIPAHVDDQYLSSVESLLVSKQPSCIVF